MNRKKTILKSREAKSPLPSPFPTSMSSTKYEDRFSDMYVVVMSTSCCKAFNGFFSYNGIQAN